MSIVRRKNLIGLFPVTPTKGKPEGAKGLRLIFRTSLIVEVQRGLLLQQGLR